MTTPTSDLIQHRVAAEAELHRIAEALSRARQDAELFARLKSAADATKRLEPQFSAAQKALVTATAAERDALDEARFDGLLDIAVRDTTPDEHVLRTTFEIRYTRIAWDHQAGQSVPKEANVTGLPGLPDEVFAFLVVKHPDKIPAKIMALAPGDPEAAIDRYFIGMRRGFIRQ